jgi:hypothetical protein
MNLETVINAEWRRYKELVIAHSGVLHRNLFERTKDKLILKSQSRDSSKDNWKSKSDSYTGI